MGLIRDVYSHPREVYVWLGEGLENQAESAIALSKKTAEECCQKLESSVEDISFGDLASLIAERNGLDKGSFNNPDKASDHPLSISARERGAVNWLFSNTWLERVWVIQEVTFASAKIHLGASQLT